MRRASQPPSSSTVHNGFSSSMWRPVLVAARVGNPELLSQGPKHFGMESNGLGKARCRQVSFADIRFRECYLTRTDPSKTLKTRILPLIPFRYECGPSRRYL